MFNKEIREAVKHIIGLDLPGHNDRQGIPLKGMAIRPDRSYHR